MKLKDCFIGQKVGLYHKGFVLTGVVESLNGEIASVKINGDSGNKVNVKYLLGVVK